MGLKLMRNLKNGGRRSLWGTASLSFPRCPAAPPPSAASPSLSLKAPFSPSFSWAPRALLLL